MSRIKFNLFKLVKSAGLSLSLLLISATSMAAQSSIETGPEIGSQMPKLVVVDQFGDKQQLNNIMGEKGAILVLFRSADWCPFCKRHLLELNDAVESFNRNGYGVTAISYDSPEILRRFAQMKKLQFSLLSDQNVATFEALNVVNQMHKPGSRHYGIPYPGVIVVDKQGKVIHKYFFEGYKKRVKFKSLLEDLNK